MKPLIYLAAPYSHPDPPVISARMEAFDAVAAQMLLVGKHVVSPLLFHSLLGQHNVPGNWTFFEAYSLSLLDRCDEIVVVSLPGWADSKGVSGELAFARAKEMEISSVDYSPEAYQRGLAKGLNAEFPTLSRIMVESILLYANNDPGIARALLKRSVDHLSEQSRALNETD